MNQIKDLTVMTEEVIIGVTRGWSLPSWRTIHHHRDLLFVLVRREFLSKFKQTILGPAWYIAQPVLTSLLFTGVFSHAAGISTDGAPPILFYMCGLLSWGYFVGCLEATAGSLVNNSHLFQKVYFPRILVPLSIVLAKLYSYVVQLALLIFLMTYIHLTHATFEFRPTLWLLLFPVILVQTACLALGAGLWVAALSTKYRDFHHLLGFVLQLWMYATPIIYPLSLINEKWKIWVLINPMCSVVETYRKMFFGAGGVEGTYFLLSIMTTVFVLITGLLVFGKVEKKFIDTL